MNVGKIVSYKLGNDVFCLLCELDGYVGKTREVRNYNLNIQTSNQNPVNQLIYDRLYDNVCSIINEVLWY